jgi:hypothetical protein
MPDAGLVEHAEVEARRKALAAHTRKVKIKTGPSSEGDAAAKLIRAAMKRIQMTGGRDE